MGKRSTHAPFRALSASLCFCGFVAAGAAAQPAPADVSADESLVSERLSSRVLGVLDEMLGPGRAKVLVEVRGERLQVRTETELVTPLTQAGPSASGVAEALRFIDLPGYYKERAAATAAEKAAGGAPQSLQPFQKNFEHSLRDAGFEIKKIEATVVLDTALPEGAAREASQLLPQLLRIDEARGDRISIVRAPMRPAWKKAFSTPGDWRTLAFAASGLLGALIVVLIGAAAFVRGARVFAMELTSKQGRGEQAEPGAAEPLPELMPGSPAGFAAAGVESAASPAGTLGRRFDFLEAADAADVARILAEEAPADLAQVFAYLAKQAPETASRLFSKLPSEAQAEASTVLLKLKAVDPDRLSEIEERLKNLVANGLRGAQRLASILSRVPGEERSMLMDRLASRDSRGVEEIQSQLFSFEDFGALSPADLRRVMGAVPYELWGTALRGVPLGLVDRILSELPEGPRGLVREEAGTPQPKDKVVAARSKILDTVLDLAAKGQVRLDQRAGAEETL
ncbi:MAG: hypothetical protein HY403_02320 [Elusimicrobia bacterium]|nr:hypothetical protein [Elusimicrobiota bacterium]